MTSLRQLIRHDRAIGAITADDCRIIGAVLDWVAELSAHWLFKYILPAEFKDKIFLFKMLAATLSRTPEERQSFTEQIRQAIDKGK